MKKYNAFLPLSFALGQSFGDEKRTPQLQCPLGSFFVWGFKKGKEGWYL